MTFRKRLLVSAALALGLALPTVTVAPVNAAGQPGGTHAGPGHVYASYEEAAPGVAPAGADKAAVYLDMDGQVLPRPESGERPADEPREDAAAFRCTPVSGRDNPHRSSTGVAVSGHGWWDKGTCSNNRAKVWNCLYEWYTDNSWRRKACSPVKELAPGGGSANRTVARHNCDNTALTSWRNHVDVDVIGEWDTAEQPYRQADVRCRVF
ncbi:hypothetical protein [Streptomyces durbertensis]|uniref:hypothetical protein n=1 Tax=Streptomyces durbertensis TaxID=2448886 RepID=UPI001E403674|nr:hypothetical protein [Streptomyces durbertensis]